MAMAWAETPEIVTVELLAETISPVKAPVPFKRIPNSLVAVFGTPRTLMVPELRKEPVLPPTMLTPVALLATVLEIVPLFETLLFESSVTAAPAVAMVTEPPVAMVTLPGLEFAAEDVATAEVVAVEIVRSLANAARENTALIAVIRRTLRFTALS